MNGISIGYKPGVSSKSDSQLIKVNSVDSLPTDNVVNGTIGLIQEEENVFESFTPGIETNALLFDTSFDVASLFNNFLSEKSGYFLILSEENQENIIVRDNNLYLPPNSIFFFPFLKSFIIIINNTNNELDIINIVNNELNYLNDIALYSYDNVSEYFWYKNYVRLNSYVSLNTFYLINGNDNLSITTESVDNYLQLNKWMKCSTNNVENKISQVYEYNGSWENISKDIILQEKSEFVNSLTPSRIEVTPDEGADTLSKVTIDLSSLELQSKTVNITQNGQTTIIPDDGKIGLDEVIINASIVNGGENLLSYNNYEAGNSFWSGVQGGKVTITNDTIRGESSETNPYPYIQNTSVSIANNFNFDTTKKYTISFKIRSNDGLPRYVGIRNPGADDIVMNLTSVETSTTFIYKTITFTPLKSSCNNGLIFSINNPNGQVEDDWIEIKEVKIEEGSIATPFSKSINDEYGWGSALEEYIDGAHGEYIKTSLLADYQNTYNSFKDLTTIPQYYAAGRSHMFIPNLPLPENTQYLFRNWYNITEIPDFLDLTNVPDISSFFAFCYSLRDFKYSKGFNIANSIDGLFSYCVNLSGNIIIDAPNATSAGSTFYLCRRISEIKFNTEKIISYGQMVNGCSVLESIFNLNLGETSSAQYSPFGNCHNLTNITFADGSIINNSISFQNSTKLTVDSILNILNILKDLTGSTSATLTLGAENLAKLTDEQKAIATNKNWVLA